MIDFFLVLGIGLGVVFGVVIFTVVFFKLGGWPEFWYRVNDVQYFVEGVIEEDGTTGRNILKSEIIKGTPPMYSSHGKKRTIDPENTARYHGRPYWIYNIDDFNPIPIFHWERGPIISAGEVEAAFERKALQDMHDVGKKNSLSFILILIVIVGIAAIVIAGVSAYYSYNAFCALNPHACGTAPTVPKIS